MRSISSPLFIEALGKRLPVHVRGNGLLSLLVLGPATLFEKPGFIPAAWDEQFTIYFVDFFALSERSSSCHYDCLQLEDFVGAVESTRAQLQLDTVVLFGHSAAGVLAMEYSTRYPDRVLFNILLCASPIWGGYKNKLTTDFFQQNASHRRHRLFMRDQRRLHKIDRVSFVHSYNARRAYFYKYPRQMFWQNLWDHVVLDEPLVNRYFSLIQNFDFRAIAYHTQTFLALGLYDASCPFYMWTDDVAAMLENIEYYVFPDSGHYPMLEEWQALTIQLRAYIDRHDFQRCMLSVTDQSLLRAV